MEFRPASLEERKRFYEKEFSIGKVKKWFRDNEMKLPQLCAVDAGSESSIIIDKKLKGVMLYFPLNELIEKIEKYLPEDIYYDRNIYKNPVRVLKTLKFNDWEGQELVFDIDAENIKCSFHKSGKVCYSCIGKAFARAKKMKRELEKIFDKIGILYSGAGFHVHVFDRKAFLLSVKERRRLNERFSDFPIDPWVSEGRIYLIRMPYSLNGLISRKVLPMKSFRADKEKTFPKFLEKF